jgi:hypothetical protein
VLRVQEMNLNVPVLIYIFNDGDDEMHKYSFIVFPHGKIQKKNTLLLEHGQNKMLSIIRKVYKKKKRITLNLYVHRYIDRILKIFKLMLYCFSSQVVSLRCYPSGD